jgi:hypothetical protein
MSTTASSVARIYTGSSMSQMGKSFSFICGGAIEGVPRVISFSSMTLHCVPPPSFTSCPHRHLAIFFRLQKHFLSSHEVTMTKVVSLCGQNAYAITASSRLNTYPSRRSPAHGLPLASHQETALTHHAMQNPDTTTTPNGVPQ